MTKCASLEGVGDEQEYPEGEEPGPDDVDEVLEKGPIGPAFLIGPLCEFFLIKHERRADLSAYLKRRRIQRHRPSADRPSADRRISTPPDADDVGQTT
ncbi:MAG: hypothetical protein GX607_12480 [Myxococcales bacterium]|nr:hypothetical protein [Myxococcales bacterium]